MFRILSTALLCLGIFCLSQAHSAGTLPLTGAGPSGSLCSPFSYGVAVTYQNLTFTGYTTVNSTLATNVIFSPACSTTGATLTEDSTASAQHNAYIHTGAGTALTAKAYTLTVFAKQIVGTRNIEVDADDSGFAGGTYIQFNLATCAPLGTPGVFGTWSGAGSSASLVGTWCKTVSTFTATVGTNPQISTMLVSGTNNTYNGDGTSSLGLWGVDWR